MAQTQIKPPGAWTYEDLFSLPEDKRYEIVEGALHEMPSPSVDHQTILLNLLFLLGPVIQRLQGRLFPSPLDVFFPGADPVQPDILVLLPGWRGTLEQRGPQGAPDMAIEILSPSNRNHDLLTKRALYGSAGVRECWIVDPERKTVDVLTLEGDALVTAQTASGDEAVVSPLLGGGSFPLPAIFANVGEDAV
jgi:Uma2 family endonuclease